MRSNKKNKEPCIWCITLPPMLTFMLGIIAGANIDYSASDWFDNFAIIISSLLSIISTIYFIRYSLYKLHRARDKKTKRNCYIELVLSVTLMPIVFLLFYYITVIFTIGSLSTVMFGKYSEPREYMTEIQHFRTNRNKHCHTQITVLNNVDNIPRIRLCNSFKKIEIHQNYAKIIVVTQDTSFGTVIYDWKIIE